MPLGEFELIDRFFRDCGATRSDVRLGVGDDAAVLECPAGDQLVAAADTLVAGRHFLTHWPSQSTGHRALAVNLSDLAAMGARPAWALLALTLPEVDERWLSGFAAGFRELALAHDVALIGGDTTAGPLCVTVQVLGHVPRSTALRRSGGRPGDVLFVSGTLGDAVCALALENGRLQAGRAEDAEWLRRRLCFPEPRVALGMRLRDYASACIDVSDGLLGDAGKLARASGCGAQIEYTQVPLSQALLGVVGEEQARRLALTGGDDYELCFSVPPERVAAMLQALPPEQWGYRRIGELTDTGNVVVMRDGSVMQFSHSGFDHFAMPADPA